MDYIELTPKQILKLKRRRQGYAWGALLALSIFCATTIYRYSILTLEALELPSVQLCSLDVVTCGYDALKPNLRLTDTIYEVLTTAYTSRVQETDSSPCIAADGSNICERYAKGEGICAANWLPLGSKIFVEGYGNCTVADRMAKKNSEKLDVYFGYDLEGAYQWGVKFIKVYVSN